MMETPTRGDVERLIEARQEKLRDAIAEAVHRGRYPADREPEPFEREDCLSREYCFRIADSVLAADALQALTGEGKKDLESARGLGERLCGAPEESVAGIYKALPLAGEGDPRLVVAQWMTKTPAPELPSHVREALRAILRTMPVPA